MTVQEQIEEILDSLKRSDAQVALLTQNVALLTAANAEIKEQNLILMEALADLGGGLV